MLIYVISKNENKDMWFLLRQEFKENMQENRKRDKATKRIKVIWHYKKESYIRSRKNYIDTGENIVRDDMENKLEII